MEDVKMEDVKMEVGHECGGSEDLVLDLIIETCEELLLEFSKDFDPPLLGKSTPQTNSQRKINLMKRLAANPLSKEQVQFVNKITHSWSLLPHQKQGVHWLLTSGEKNGLIVADEMGLGKTWMVLAYLLWVMKQEQKKDVHLRLPLLLIVTPGMLDEWKHLIDVRFRTEFQGFEILYYHGGKVKQFKREGSGFNNFNLIVTTAQTAVNTQKASPSTSDNATASSVTSSDSKSNSKLSESNSKSSKSNSKLSKSNAKSSNTTSRMDISSPATNHLEDLEFCVICYDEAVLLAAKHSYFSNLRSPKTILISATPFGCDGEAGDGAILRILNKNLGDEYSRLSSEGRTQLVIKYLRDYTLRRGNQDQDSQGNPLNPSSSRLVSVIVHTPFVEHEREYYEAKMKALKEKEAGHNVLMQSIELMNNSTHSIKTDFLAILAGELSLAGNKIVIFMHFHGMMDAVERKLLDMEFVVVKHYSGLGKVQEAIDEFNDPLTSSRIMLIGMGVAAVGINLSSANIIICPDYFWSRSSEEQALTRVIRKGQTNETVHLIKVVTPFTWDSEMRAYSNEAGELVASAWQKADTWMTE